MAKMVEKNIILSDEWLTYYFSINFFSNNIFPFLRFHDNEPYSILNYAFVSPYNKSHKMLELITNFENVKNKNNELFFANNEIQIEGHGIVTKYTGGGEAFYSTTAFYEKMINDWYNFLLTYESCQIPGLIPESKLNTWSCVPNEYIKPEYWELLKKQQQKQKDNEI